MPDDTTPAGGTHRQLGLGTAGLIERSITLLMVVVLLVGVLAILKPFAAAILFGATLAIAAWPLRQWMIGRGVGPRLTAVLLLLLSLLVIVLPALIMAPVLTDELKAFTESVENYFAATPQRPGWIENVPLVGGKLASAWDGLLEAKGDVATALAPQSEILQRWLITAARALGDSVVQMILALIVATMFCINGSKLVEELDSIVVRLGGATAHASLLAAAGAVRSVSYGVIGTALAQAALLVLGLALAGVPGATTLGFVGLLLSISQIGAPLLVLGWCGVVAVRAGPGRMGELHGRMGNFGQYGRQRSQTMADRSRHSNAYASDDPGRFRWLYRLWLPWSVYWTDAACCRFRPAAGMADESARLTTCFQLDRGKDELPRIAA